jgi:hypothetical protein
MYTIDSKILNACTKFSHATQRAIGITNYFIAKIGIAFASVDIGVSLLNYLHQFLRQKTPLVLVFLQIILLVSFYMRTFSLTKADEQLLSGSGTKPREFMVLSWIGWRLVWLSIFASDMADLTIRPPHGPYWLPQFVSVIFFSFGLSVFYYFVAVDPLPPGKNRVRVWIECLRLYGKLAPAPAENQ